MQCPKCSGDMLKVKYENIEVDRCERCKGIWFDMLEHEDLKKISGSEAIDIGFGDASIKKRTATDKIMCPKCKQPLINMVVAAQPHISYEACVICYGVYFDAGEFTDFREETFAESWKSLFGKHH